MAKRAPVLQAGATVSFTLEGADELIKILQQIGKKAAGRVLMEATLDGAQVIADEANRRAPGPHVETNAEDIQPTSITVAIGPDREHWYYLFAETGTQPHEIPASSILSWGPEAPVFGNVMNPADHPGAPADPFMRPAVAYKQDEALAAIGERIRQEIERGTNAD